MEIISRLVATFLVNALWQVPLVAAAAALAARLMRSAPARYQHLVWLAALGLSFALPLASLRVATAGSSESSRNTMSSVQEIPLSVNSARGALPAKSNRTKFTEATVGGSARHSPASGEPFRMPALAISAALARYVALGFLLFLLLRLAGFVGVWRRTQEVARSAHSQPLPSWAAELAERSRRAFGVGPVPILFSSEVRSPLTLGARRPSIVLPEGFLEQADRDQLASALCHEMAHIARHDYLLNLVAEIIYLPVAFHPVVSLIRRRVSETRELASDEMAAGRLVPDSEYARSLVAIADALAIASQTSQPNYSLGVFDANNLEDRVMRLIHPGPRAGPRFAKLLIVAGFFLVALVFLAAARFPLTVAQTGATAEKANLKSLVGNWTAKFEGLTYMLVSLKQNGDALGGSVSLGNFGVDENGQVNHVQDEPNPDYAQPIISTRMDGDTLRLSTRNKRGVEQLFQMKIGRGNEAMFKWSRPESNPLGAEPGWWTITRSSAKAEDEETPGGPSAGVVGGVPGGVSGGVPGRTQRIEREVTGSPSGKVSDPSGAAKVEGTVSGVVEDPSGARLVSAIVSLIAKAGEPERTAATDETGEFLIDHVNPGSYRLVVRYPNFELAEAKIRVAGPEDKTVVNVIMSPRGLMEWVTVKAKKPPEIREKPAPGGTNKIREGGQLEAGKPLYKTEPIYPESSKRKGTQGDVILEAVISIEGVPLSVKAIKSPDPDLAVAAIAAVKQWRYQPAKLNGVPVEVVTDITVRSTLEN